MQYNTIVYYTIYLSTTYFNKHNYIMYDTRIYCATTKYYTIHLNIELCKSFRFDIYDPVGKTIN